ncbi:MAG: acyl-CoA thioesterase [Planctomycetes bacterium]|nr:acyl-CoA thioesterase [Planctomycetota bacterium]
MHVPQVPDPSRIRFRCKARTRWSDEDNQNVLNNAVYLTLLEEGRHAYFQRLGLLEQNHFPFVLGSCNLRFASPGRGGVEVEIEVVTTRLGQSSFEQAYRVRETASGRVWCEAQAVLVTYDARSGRSSPMTSAFRSALAEFEGLA